MSRPFYSDTKKAKNVSFFFFFLVTLFISTRFLKNYWRYRQNWYTPRTVSTCRCAFWGFVDIAPLSLIICVMLSDVKLQYLTWPDIAPHFGAEIPTKHQFWGVNRRFQAKRAKHFCIYLNIYEFYWILNFRVLNSRSRPMITVQSASKRILKIGVNICPFLLDDGVRGVLLNVPEGGG